MALRPRLSTGLPLSLKRKCQIVADRSQVRIVCRGSQVVSHIGDSGVFGGLCSGYGGSRIPETAGAGEMLGIETAPEIAVPDRDASARCMNEAALPRIDADMIDAAFTDMEEHQVTGGELCDRYRARGTLLFRCGARDREAHAFVYVERKTAAVEAGTVGTPELVWGAHQRRRHGGDGAPLDRARRWRTGTAGERHGASDYGRGESGRGTHG